MKINVVVALAAAACVLAAPSKKQIQCKPHEEMKLADSNGTAVTKGFLTMFVYHREKDNKNNLTLLDKRVVGTLQPSEGKLKLSTLSPEKLNKEGKQFQVMSCNVEGEEYQDKIVPDEALGNNTVVRGQLKTGDECLAAKDGEVKLEKCATTEEELKPQIFASSQTALVNVHGNKTRTLIVDVKDRVVTNMREGGNETGMHFLWMLSKPQMPEGNGSGVQLRVTMGMLAVALATAWVLV